MEGQDVNEGAQAGARPKREGHPTEAQLISTLQQTRDKLNALLSIRLATVQTNATQLKALQHDIKKIFRLFETCSRAYARHLIATGCPSEAGEIRSARMNLRVEVDEAIDEINSHLRLLGLDELSKLSMAQSLSFNSTFDSVVLERPSKGRVLEDHSVHRSSSPVMNLEGDLASLQLVPPAQVLSAVAAPFIPVMSQPPGLGVLNEMSSMPVRSPGLVSTVQSLPPSTLETYIHAPPVSAVAAQASYALPNINLQPPRWAPPISDRKAVHFHFDTPRMSTSDIAHPVNPNGPNLTHQEQVPAYQSQLINPTVPVVPALPVLREDNGTVAMKTMANCFLQQQEIIKKSIKPFDGHAHKFWAWANKIKYLMTHYTLDPQLVANLLESHTEGAPRRMIESRLSAVGFITAEVVNNIWESLVKRYGAVEEIARDLLERLRSFPRIQEPNVADQMYDLVDLCRIAQYNMSMCLQLQSLNQSSDLEVLRRKLPIVVQQEWWKTGQRYEETYFMHPPFSVFVEFLEKQTARMARQNYKILRDEAPKRGSLKVMHTAITATSTTVPPRMESEEESCPIHKSRSHPIEKCDKFKKLSFDEKQKTIFQMGACYRCLKTGHRAAVCTVEPKCDTCQGRHLTILHCSKEELAANRTASRNSGTNRSSGRGSRGRSSVPKGTGNEQQKSQESGNDNKDETSQQPPATYDVKCTKLCNDSSVRKDCSKTVLLDVVLEGVPGRVKTIYAILDNQANVTLIDERLVHFFGKDFSIVNYNMRYAKGDAGTSTRGYYVTGLKVKGALEDELVDIPWALSCGSLTDTRGEVATPEIVRAHKHIAHFADHFPSYCPEAEVMMLIGRNVVRAMATESQITPAPYVHRTPLGYALVGPACVSYNSVNSDSHWNNHCSNINVDNDNVLTPYEARALRTTLMPYIDRSVCVQLEFQGREPGCIGEDVFHRGPDDDIPGLSREDVEFLKAMESGVCVTAEGNLELPLPVRNLQLPDNHLAVLGRTQSTLSQLNKNNRKLQLCVESMQKSLDNHFVEQVPVSERKSAVGCTWYIPIFCVEESKKNKIRLVYDAAAKYNGISLNDALYTGPDLNNNLRGVLLRFREKPIAVVADIQAMFNNFHVPVNQRDLLRYYWFDNNDCNKPLVPYRAVGHIFGCSSSPAVASYGLKYCASKATGEEYINARRCINHSCYVDDILYSVETAEQAIDILCRAREILSPYNIHLHKINSNSKRVIDHFPLSERAVDATKMNMQPSSTQRVLGVVWCTKEDVFTMDIVPPKRSFTKRGIVSVIGAAYDPQGFVGPVILAGRLIQREIIPHKQMKSDMQNYGWDTELPQGYRVRWAEWMSSLVLLRQVRVPRSFYPLNVIPERQELHIFCDASDKAIGYVAYMRTVSTDKRVSVAFVSSASRVAPRCATTTPRMELNAAVEASRGASAIALELERKPEDIFMYSDSQVILGYLTNMKKRFTKYVARRVGMIFDHTSMTDWYYVPTDANPADLASRATPAEDLLASDWYHGPKFLQSFDYRPVSYDSSRTPSVLPEELHEDITTTILLTIQEEAGSILTPLFSTIKDFNKLIRICQIVKIAVHRFHQKRDSAHPVLGEAVQREEARKFLIKEAQKTHFGTIIATLKSGKSLPDNCKIGELSPQLDSDGLLRVGGRLKRAELPADIKHPYLVPRSHPLATAIVLHFHKKVKHQGEHLSHGKVQQQGYHIEGGKQLIREVIKKCLICRKLRGKLCTQLMSDLPVDRLAEAPPFLTVGLDVFGPFYIHKGMKTRKTTPSTKIWVLILVCLPSRAVHLEYLEGMDTVSFRLALFRFMSIRGTCRTIYCDNGTNFVGARNQLAKIDMKQVSSELGQENVTWHMSPPHASHFSGHVERRIGSVRRIFEASLLLLGNRGISRDEFITLLHEAASVVNNTPLWVVPNHPDEPLPLSPAMLLTSHLQPNPPPLEIFTEEDILAYGPRRYRRVQYLTNVFWKRWRSEYLLTLTRRRKWKKKKRCIAVGDVVLIRDKTVPRNIWPMGRVTTIKQSKDNLVRAVELIVAPLGGGTPRPLVRAVTDLVLLVPHITTE